MKIKSTFEALLMACSILATSQVAAEGALIEKIYIEENQIHVTQDCIEIELPEGSFVTDLICKDINGYYVLSDWFMVPKKSFFDRVHERIQREDREKCYNCPHCPFRASSRSSLKKHMKNNH